MNEKPIKDETATCHICGQEFENPKPEEMAEHIVFNHPLDLLENRQFQRRIFGIMENLGGNLADFLQRKFTDGKS